MKNLLFYVTSIFLLISSLIYEYYLPEFSEYRIASFLLSSAFFVFSIYLIIYAYKKKIKKIMYFSIFMMFAHLFINSIIIIYLMQSFPT